MSSAARYLSLSACATALLLLLQLPNGHAQELSFAGSAQLDYLHVFSNERARAFTLDGFTTELSMKVSVDVNENISGQIKVCSGCHGFELPAAHVDVLVGDFLSLRAGRFVPEFGDFPTRYDPANHLSNSKPLPYDMGRMLRLRDWNMSVLPAPYVDNGLELGLDHNIEDALALSYFLYLVGGLRASEGATDVDWKQMRSRDFYYVDNNSEPMLGGRILASIFMSKSASLRLGASAVWGHYDPDAELDSLIVGADLVLLISGWALRAEYLFRRNEMALGAEPEQSFIYGPGADGAYDPYFLKDGFYVETDVPIVESFSLYGRWDGLRRWGNVAVGSTLRSQSALLRYTLGLNWEFVRSWRLKATGEFYDFSDFGDETAAHLGIVGSF
ncbi:MAG: hypothetical protein RBU37_10905 [Myxococcota bacterium]|jgi:hypothetical protein|nr:hypothetical protein [Myxococcota bacterium]